MAQPFKTVPKEPTAEMLAAGIVAGNSDHVTTAAVWRAMLKAAPSPSSGLTESGPISAFVEEA